LPPTTGLRDSASYIDQLTPLTLMHINMQSLMGRADPWSNQRGSIIATYLVSFIAGPGISFARSNLSTGFVLCPCIEAQLIPDPSVL